MDRGSTCRVSGYGETRQFKMGLSGPNMRLEDFQLCPFRSRVETVLRFMSFDHNVGPLNLNEGLISLA
jgi:hypothetical protein